MEVLLIIALIGAAILVPSIAAFRGYTGHRTVRSAGGGDNYSFSGDSSGSGCDASAAGDGGCDGGGGGGD
jgi:hypothetical protein